MRPAPLEARCGADRSIGFTGVSFGGTEQAYTILSVAPVRFHVSRIVTLPNVSVTLDLPIDIFDRDVLPVSGPERRPARHAAGTR